jgi:hypothetical protein
VEKENQALTPPAQKAGNTKYEEIRSDVLGAYEHIK